MLLYLILGAIASAIIFFVALYYWTMIDETPARAASRFVWFGLMVIVVDVVIAIFTFGIASIIQRFTFYTVIYLVAIILLSLNIAFFLGTSVAMLKSIFKAIRKR